MIYIFKNSTKKIRCIEYFDYKQCLITLFQIYEIPKITIPIFAILNFAIPIFPIPIPIFTILKNTIPNSEYRQIFKLQL